MSENKYRRDIDGLRTIAVMAVVLFHAFPSWLPGGFVGVDVFFVISGYLITGIIVADLNAGRFNLVDFYAKRARRIFPALVIVLAACMAVGWFLLLPDEYALLGKHTAGGSAFVANIVLMFEYGYFDVSSVFKPLLHLWSLGVEEQFYFVWPALLIMAFGVRLRLVWLTMAIAAASFSISLWLTTTNANEAFYLPYSRFWELMIGAALAIALPRRAPRKAVAEAISVAGLLSIVAAILTVREGSNFPAPAALIAVIGAGLIIAAGPLSSANKLVLGNRIAVWVGLISYPLYLWHWPLLSFPAIVVSGDTPRSWRIAAVLIAIVLAALTFWLVEKPIRKIGHLRTTAFAATAGLAGLFVIGMYAYQSGGIPSRPVVQAMETVQGDFEGSMWRFTSNDICLDRYFVPGQADYGWWFCVQNKEGKPDVLLVGDSFANHYYAGLQANSAFAGLTLLSIGACEPSIIRKDEVVDVAGSFSPCTPVRKFDQQALIDRIIAGGPPQLVIMAGLMPTEPGKVPVLTDDYSTRILERIGQFRDAGSDVVAILPHLRAEYFTRGCFGRPLAEPQFSCVVTPETVAQHSAGSAALRAAIEAEFPEVAVFDPNVLFCNDGRCGFTSDGRPLFRDEYDHFTANASEMVVELLVTELRRSHPEILPQQAF